MTWVTSFLTLMSLLLPVNFGKLSGKEQHEVLTLFKEKELFRLFETGLVDEDGIQKYDPGIA